MLKWNLGEYGTRSRTSSELGKRNHLTFIAKLSGTEIAKEGRSPCRELQPKIIAWGRHCLESLVDYRCSGILTSLTVYGREIRFATDPEVLTNCRENIHTWSIEILSIFMVSKLRTSRINKEFEIGDLENKNIKKL